MIDKLVVCVCVGGGVSLSLSNKSKSLTSDLIQFCGIRYAHIIVAAHLMKAKQYKDFAIQNKRIILFQ